MLVRFYFCERFTCETEVCQLKFVNFCLLSEGALRLGTDV